MVRDRHAATPSSGLMMRSFRRDRHTSPSLVPDHAPLRSRLEAARVTIVEDEPLEGFDRFYVNDPFGNRLECLQRHSVDSPEDRESR